MLYRKGLKQLSSEYDNTEEQQQIETEIARTEGLTIDQTLDKFAKENTDVLK